MISARDVNQEELVKEVAEELKKDIEAPEWSQFVKTGTAKERPPEDENWWFMRSASILRKIYMEGPLGVSRLRSYYGSSKNMGHKPHHFKKSGGKIIRTILKDLEEKEFIKKNLNKGRVIASKGQKLLDSTAKKISA